MPEADEDIRQALEDLRRLEAERCPSMDRAADTSSRMTAAVVPRTGDTRERILHQMFYQIGRWIYLVDAVQDIQKDMEENSYNPVVLRYELQTPNISAVREPLERTLERSLADICMAFDPAESRERCGPDPQYHFSWYADRHPTGTERHLPDKRRKGQTWIPIKCSV